MRTIKFRAWDKREKRWLGVNLHMSVIDGLLWWQFGYGCEILSAEERENIELVQYIEREDKNKKEMYEGDVVKWVNNFGEENIGWIRYTKPIAGFYIVLIKGSYIPFYTGSERNFSWTDLEIIGNIYENPELLGEKERDIIKELKEK